MDQCSGETLQAWKARFASAKTLDLCAGKTGSMLEASALAGLIFGMVSMANCEAQQISNLWGSAALASTWPQCRASSLVQARNGRFDTSSCDGSEYVNLLGSYCPDQILPPPDSDLAKPVHLAVPREERRLPPGVGGHSGPCDHLLGRVSELFISVGSSPGKYWDSATKRGVSGLAMSMFITLHQICLRNG